jgi:hypothetical protein
MGVFDDDMASGRRIVAMEEPSKKLAVLVQWTREAVRWFLVRNMRKPDVVDAIRSVGLGGGLCEVDVQSGLAQAIDHPFVPPSPPSGGRTKQVARDRLVIRRASEIEAKPVRWLWPNRIPIGKVTLIGGEPGLGKSQLTCAIAAAISTGGQWPCGGEGDAPTGSLIIFSAEDDAEDTIKPRLEAAGADPTRILIVSAVETGDRPGRRSFNLQSDLPPLEQAILGTEGAIAVIVDPMTSYLGKVDSHKNAELRAVLEPLAELAARLGVAIVGTRT